MGTRTPNTEDLLRRILYWTGGHPYLTQRLCQAVAAEAAGGRGDRGTGGPSAGSVAPSPPRPLAPSVADVDRLCEALFLSASAREKDDNLLFVRERLLKSEAGYLPEGEALASLLDLYAQVWRGKRVGVDDTNPLIDLLRLSGLARLADNRLVVRNRIYARVFDRNWVTTHMPDAELRRQRAAYRRGAQRTAAVPTLIVGVIAGLAVTAARSEARARRLARQRLLALGEVRETLGRALRAEQQERELRLARHFAVRLGRLLRAPALVQLGPDGLADA